MALSTEGVGTGVGKAEFWVRQKVLAQGKYVQPFAVYIYVYIVFGLLSLWTSTRLEILIRSVSYQRCRRHSGSSRRSGSRTFPSSQPGFIPFICEERENSFSRVFRFFRFFFFFFTKRCRCLFYWKLTLRRKVWAALISIMRR